MARLDARKIMGAETEMLRNVFKIDQFCGMKRAVRLGNVEKPVHNTFKRGGLRVKKPRNLARIGIIARHILLRQIEDPRHGRKVRLAERETPA